MTKMIPFCTKHYLVLICAIQLALLPLHGGIFVPDASADPAVIDGAAIKPAESVPNEIIVKFKEGVEEREINDLLSKYNTTVKSVNLRAGFYLLKYTDKQIPVRELVNSFSENREYVAYAEPNYILHADLTPDDPLYPELWGLNNTSQTGGLTDADIDAPEAWDIQTGSSSVVVAVIDTGVDYNHPDLAANIWTNPGEIPDNGIDDDGNGFTDDVHGWNFVGNNNDPMDDHSHGTHCSGTIAGIGNNAEGVAGVSWNSKIMPLKFLDADGYGTTDNAVLAIQYATLMGAKVMSNSWGGGGYSVTLYNAISAAHQAGSVFVAAAGNNGSNNDVVPHYPSNYDVPNVIAVSATDHDDLLAWWSNYGPNSVHLGAPGVNILSTIPYGGYGLMSGTSMACPHVSGVAALLFAQNPELTNLDVKSGVVNSVDLIPALDGKVISQGRLNAYGALINVGPPPPKYPITVFQDTMENGTGGWTISDSSLWHQSTHRADSPVTAWYYGKEDLYKYNTGARNFGSLTSPTIDLTGITSSRLIFRHFLATENYPPNDTAVIRITKDGGATYTDVLSKTTTNGLFIEENLDISQFDHSIIRIQLFFDTIDAYFNNFEGWYLDDVAVKGQTLVPPPNQPPVAVAGPDLTVADTDGNDLETACLDGSGSSDPDGTIVGYEWSEAGTILGTEAILNHDFSVAGSPHVLTLKVTDNGGAIAVDETTVVVKANQAPVAEAGPDKNTYAGNIVTFDGSGSSDPEGIIVASEWSFGDGATAPTAIAGHAYTAPGIYTASLSVTDNGGRTATDTCIVRVSAMHIDNILMSLVNVKAGKNTNTNAKATVLILDASGLPVQGATVSGKWSGLTSDTDSGLTGSDGKVSLDSNVLRNAKGTFTFTVQNVSKAGWFYDSSANVKTGGSISR